MSNLSFKCHRDPHPTKKNTTDVYAVHAVSFSPAAEHKHDMLASAGSDGTFAVWDVRKRVRQLGSAKASGPMTAVAFSKDGGSLVYALGYDWAQGYLGNKAASSSSSSSKDGAAAKVVIHKFGDALKK